FVEAMKILHQVADVAEAEQHHPDLHLTGYRKVRIDLTTHAIGGLSENDFIVAAKIDEMLA
ncbi:MAG: 4a-hydroxytetrahydrobiopterin dehydratase, partial [Planctomycetota bacterium]